MNGAESRDLVEASLGLVLALAPVLTFLLVLIVLDSYKLVRPRLIAWLLVAGGLAALGSLVLGRWVGPATELEPVTFARYVAPVVEEILKGTVVVVLVTRNRVGFLVDAAICGFAVGAGFAAVENAYYFTSLPEAGLVVWLIRGFGTAIMHGGVTAIMSVVSKTLGDGARDASLQRFVPGWLLAMALHSAFNHFFLAPDLSTLLLLVALPVVFLIVFRTSEMRTRDWLGSGFDTDAELLALVSSGRVSESRIGEYLHTLKDSFEGKTVADMICLLRLRLELSIRAKGILLMRKAGLRIEPDPEVEARFEELEYLEKAIGPTGLLALSPIFYISDRDLWQYHTLVRGGSRPPLFRPRRQRGATDNSS